MGQLIYEYLNSDFTLREGVSYYTGPVMRVFYPATLNVDPMRELLDWQGFGYKVLYFHETSCIKTFKYIDNLKLI